MLSQSVSRLVVNEAHAPNRTSNDRSTIPKPAGNLAVGTTLSQSNQSQGSNMETANKARVATVDEKNRLRIKYFQNRIRL